MDFQPGNKFFDGLLIEVSGRSIVVGTGLGPIQFFPGPGLVFQYVIGIFDEGNFQVFLSFGERLKDTAVALPIHLDIFFADQEETRDDVKGPP
jgi:hypothetical protein